MRTKTDNLSWSAGASGVLCTACGEDEPREFGERETEELGDTAGIDARRGRVMQR